MHRVSGRQLHFELPVGMLVFVRQQPADLRLFDRLQVALPGRMQWLLFVDDHRRIFVDRLSGVLWRVLRRQMQHQVRLRLDYGRLQHEVQRRLRRFVHGDRQRELPGAVPGEQLFAVQVGAVQHVHDSVPAVDGRHILRRQLRERRQRRAMHLRAELYALSADQRHGLVVLRWRSVHRVGHADRKNVVFHRFRRGGSEWRRALAHRSGACDNGGLSSTPRRPLFVRDVALSPRRGGDGVVLTP